jgi:hypothetical protein
LHRFHRGQRILGDACSKALEQKKTVVIGLGWLRLEGEDEPDLATTLTREEMQSLRAWAGQ